MRVVFAGTPDVAVPALEAVAVSRHELVGVLSRPDAPAGRGRKLVASPVAQRAAELGVPVLTPERPTDPDFQAELRALAPECCPVVAYGALLPASALAIPTHGWVNLHFSLLPAYRGAAPVQHAIRSGETMTGATTFRIVPELDAGPTFGVMTQEVGPTETAGSLLDTLSRGGAELLVATLDGIEDGTVEAREQPEDGLSYAGKLTAAEGEVDWGRSSLAIDRQIRACTPAPGAWTRFEGERFKLGPVTPVDDLPGDSPAPTPGELVVTKKAVFVGTGTTPVRLGSVKPFGKKEMPAADWARGVRVESGATVGG